MQILKDRIRSDGRVLSRDVLMVDSFLNHQVDPIMMQAIGREFARRYRADGVTKVLTIEASGIAAALMTGLELGVPVVFAKKGRGRTQIDQVFTAMVKSFTRGESTPIVVTRRFLSSQDRVLIVDDFLAHGEAARGLISLVEQAGAALVGVGIVVEKGFQGGGRRLRDQGVPVDSLVIIESMNSDGIRFADDD